MDDSLCTRNVVEEKSDGSYVIKFHDGHEYSGSFSSGMMNNTGKYTWCDGLLYEGDFKDCRITGKGKYVWPDGSFYIGEVLNGLRHGRGEFYCANNGAAYFGEWHMGKRHGEGRLVYSPDQDYFYEGQWVDNMKQGYGVERYKSGDMYRGEWYKNQRHGNGIMYWLTLNEVYDGQWESGLQHGFGKHTLWMRDSNDNTQYPIRNIYVGEWKGGLRDGNGLFYYASGATFEGQWKMNKKFGEGNYVLKESRSFQCYFDDDKALGEHTGPFTINFGKDDDSKITVNELEYAVKECLPCNFTKDVQSVLLRYISELKQIYNFYSSLGVPAESREKSSMKKLQFSAFLRDINISQHGLSISAAESCHAGQGYNPEEIMEMKDFVQSILNIALRIYTPGKQFSKFLTNFLSAMTDDAGNVGGLLFLGSPPKTSDNLMYQEKLWQIYTGMKREGSEVDTVRYRDCLLLLKDCGIIDTIFKSTEVVNIMSKNSADFDTDMKLSFLEFYEVLLSCANSAVPFLVKKFEGPVQWKDYLHVFFSHYLTL